MSGWVTVIVSSFAPCYSHTLRLKKPDAIQLITSVKFYESQVTCYRKDPDTHIRKEFEYKNVRVWNNQSYDRKRRQKFRAIWFGLVKNKNADRLRFRSFTFDSQRKNRIRGCSVGHNKSQTTQAFPPTTIYFMAIYFIPCVRPTMCRHGHSHEIRALRLMLHSITEPVTFSLLNISQRSHVHSVHASPHHIRIKIILSDSFFSPDSFYVVEFKIYEKTN